MNMANRRICFLAGMLMLVGGCGGDSGVKTNIGESIICSSYKPPVDIKKIEPASGGKSGGTKVTITATAIRDCTETVSVYFGGKAATDVKVISDTQLTCVTPPGTVGKVQVQVSARVDYFGGSGSDVLPDGFEYL